MKLAPTGLKAIRRQCPLARKSDCPYVQELQQRRVASFEIPQVPGGLIPAEKRVYIAISKLIHISGRQRPDWLLCGQDQLADLMGCGRVHVGRLLRKLEGKGVIEMATKDPLRKLIDARVIAAQGPYGTAVRLLT